MKVLIISFYFPPYHSIASVRTGKTAKYLEKFGHEVRVIAAQNDSLASNMELEISADQVKYTKWLKLAPDHLQKNVGGLVAGSNVLYNFARKCWRMFRSVIYFPDVFVGWIPYAIKAADELLRTWKPDIILVSVAPYSSLFAASSIAKKFKIPWIADFRDLWTDNHYYPFGRVRKYIEGKVENKLLAGASGLVTVSGPLADKLKLRFQGPVETVCNGFDPADYFLFSGPAGAGTSEAKLELVYMGTLYDDFQDPSPLFQALQRFEADEVKVSFYGTLSPRLRSLVKRMGIENKVEFHESVSYIQSLGVQKKADILLFLLWTDTEEKGVYTGKLFEYLGAGRVILSVGPDCGVAADLIKERHLGVILNSPEEIYLQLKKWIDEKRKTGSIASVPLQSRAGFSREEQTKKLEQFMQNRLRESYAAR